MARGNCILVEPEPKGRFEEITVVGTPKPGTVMSIIPNVSVYTTGGRTSMEPAGTTAANSTFSGMAADGDRIPICVLLSSADPCGAAAPPFKGPTDAYATGERGVVYYPIAGEELNMILKDETGTGAGEDYVIGSKLIVDDGTGKLVQSVGTPESEPFLCLELKTDLAADYLAWVQYTGH